MKFSPAQLAALHIATFAAVAAQLVNKGRSKPQYVAHMAKRYAEAAVAEHKNGKK